MAATEQENGVEPVIMTRGTYNAIRENGAESERLAILVAYREIALEDFQVWLYARCGLGRGG